MLKQIQDYPNYAIDEEGNVWSLRTGKRLKPCFNSKGYHRVNLYKNGKRKWAANHRLVAEAFIPNPDNLPQINHIDENKTNNKVDNLEWCDGNYNLNYGTRLERIGKSHWKPVFCVELNIIFPSMTEAERRTGALVENISKACKSKKTAGGYHWNCV